MHYTRHLIVSLFFGWIEPSIISQFSFRTGNCNVGTKLMAIWDMKIFWSDTFDHQLTYCVKLSIAKSFKFSLIHFYFHLSLRYLGKYFSKQIGHLSPIYFEHARPQKPICFLRVWKLQTLESVLDLKVLSLCCTYLQNKSKNLKMNMYMNLWYCPKYEQNGREISALKDYILLGSYYTYWSYYMYCLNFFLIESIISTGRSQ